MVVAVCGTVCCLVSEQLALSFGFPVRVSMHRWLLEFPDPSVRLFFETFTSGGCGESLGPTPTPDRCRNGSSPPFAGGGLHRREAMIAHPWCSKGMDVGCPRRERQDEEWGDTGLHRQKRTVLRDCLNE